MSYTVTLSNGVEIPAVGFGTWQCTEEKLSTSLRTALDVGYRHIDTAYAYGNEEAIGDVLQEYFATGKLKREDVFITTKLWFTHMAKHDVKSSFENSLKKLKLSYVDLYLIHGPCGLKNRQDGTLFPIDSEGKVELENYNLKETWQEMESLVDDGKIRSLGVSNFNSVQVDLICESARFRPVINQVECHAYLPQVELQEFCRKIGVVLTAYAPLGSPGRPEDLVTKGEPVLLLETILQDIGRKYNKTPAQVLLRNLMQRGIIVIPKSTTASRIRENFEVFDFQLSDEDMKAVAALRKDHRFFKFLMMAGRHPKYPFGIPY